VEENILQEKNIIERDIDKRDFKRGGEVSSKLKSLLRKLGVDSAIIRKVSIISYELEMNIIIHSEGGRISASITSAAINVSAKDKGPGIEDLNKALQPGFSTATDEIRELGFGAGMGLNNVKNYSDQMEVETDLDKGTEVRVKINL
jgi:anti-sigma regulatory factor (Ser/Thr protein kinase)